MRSERLAQQQIQFVAGVSHELRTPIAVLHSASENLADGIVKTPEQAQRYGTVMKREIVRLMEMTERTLSFAGIQSGKRMFDFQPALLADIVTAYLLRNHEMLEQEGCTVLVQHDTTLPLIPLDSRAIDSVLDNLVSNAVKYGAVPYNDSETPAATMLAVQARRELRITTCRVGNDAVLSVQDFGRGIAPKDHKHIFEPFFRTAEALNAQIHGSGLGLSIVRHIVKQHGGSIRLESAIGSGTTFFVHLPIPRENAPEMSR
jgi:signal transduction histidine kinase